MPRPALGPRLFFDKKRDSWHVRDVDFKSSAVSKGKDEGKDAAERALTRYREEKEKAEDRNEEAAKVVPPPPDTMAAIIPAYVADRKAEGIASYKELRGRAEALLAFFADDRPSDLTRDRLREYVDWRGEPREYRAWNARSPSSAKVVMRSATPATVARDIRDLQSAINMWASDHGRSQFRLWRPPEAAPRERWLTRDEVARLLQATRQRPRQHARTRPDKDYSDKLTGGHLRRLILLGVNTGRRRSALCGLRWDHVDLETGFIDFRTTGRRETKKRRGFAVAPPSFLSHLRRWHREGGEYVVELDGRPVGDPKKAFASACARAGLHDVTPHTLKHTAITWAALRRVDLDDAAVFFDTSRATLERVYRQHAPEILARVARQLGTKTAP